MKVQNYAEWNENNKLEITLESSKAESSKFSIASPSTFTLLNISMFRRVSVEGLACDQMFCTSDIWVDRIGTVLASVVKSWCG